MPELKGRCPRCHRMLALRWPGRRVILHPCLGSFRKPYWLDGEFTDYLEALEL